MTTDKSKNFFRVSAEDFKKIPGSPIAYWVSSQTTQCYQDLLGLSNYCSPVVGVQTGCNDIFLRFWYEVSMNKTSIFVYPSRKKWYPCNKGGDFRRWFGNNNLIINWENDGFEIRNANGSYVRNPSYYFREGITWSTLANALSMRYTPAGFMFETKGSMCFLKTTAFSIFYPLAVLNSIAITPFLNALSPTLDFHEGPLGKVPFVLTKQNYITEQAKYLIELAKYDWDSYETSWDFQMNPLCVSPQERAEPLSYGIHSEERAKAVSLISERYMRLRWDWQQQTVEMRNLEIENNRIFIDAYGLQDELSPEVPWNEITLTCNPWYRYGKKPEDMDLLGNSFYMNISEGKVMPTSKQEEDCPARDFPFAAETEQRLLEDTIKEFISYAVGCMMGRYSLALPGLAIANQGESLVEFLEIHNEKLLWGIPQCSSDDMHDMYQKAVDVCGFIPDEDGVLPILDEEWFADDIVTQFKAFVASTFGKENLTANMDFIEAVLGKDIRKYFVKDFYKEHIQRYKKRPIYWLFSSPKGSFNALIYLHRYTPDTVSIVLNEYLRELMTKISTRIKHLIEENNRADISNADKTRNLKQIDKYTAQLAELEDYERDVIFPLAQQKIAIDLDDGVKVNYCKFGAALKKIPGLEAKEE